MHKRLLVGTIVAGLALTACGSSGDDDASVAAEEPAGGVGTNGRYRGEGSDDLLVETQEQAAVADSQAYATEGPLAVTAPPAPGPVEPSKVADDPQSTFALDVDGGAYTYCRATLQTGVLCSALAVRTEEFVNYFDMDYTAPTDDSFALHVDGAPSPLAPGRFLLRVGLQAREPVPDRRPAVLTFVVDVSGSMADPGKLDLVKESLTRLVNTLDTDDRVAIVVYGDTARVHLESTAISERQAILDKIAELVTEGSTNVDAGLTLGYEVARQNFSDDSINRVILASDGVANVGAVTPDAILANIRDNAGKGIQMVTVGFGLGEFNDPLMEQLANDGDGFYAYVDGPREAERLFTTNLTSTLEVLGIDAKAQVTFDPQYVSTYKLLGYENRALADDQFRDDTVDGGEIGTGHSVTALYEVELTEGAQTSATIGSVALRWKQPGSLEAVELARDITGDDIAATYEETGPRFRLATTAAMFAAALLNPTAPPVAWDQLAAEADQVAGQLNGDADVTELAELIRRARDLAP